MTKYNIENLAGQRLMAGFNGTSLNNDIKELIKDFKIGGLILFSRNIESPKQIKNLCLSIQEYAAYSDIPPVFISIDQEGGEVARLKNPFVKSFPGNPGIKNKKHAIDFAKTTAQLLKNVHINMNMAPVMDYVPMGFNSIMKNRVFKGTPKKIAELGCYVINEMQKHKVMACAKHFPGIGRTELDSHIDRPVLMKNFEILEKTDFIPFIAAKNSNVSAIMLSHILYPELDEKWSASLSPKIANNLLRQKIGYKGLIITDDLDMKAVKHDIKTCIKQIIRAEIDIALICHKGPPGIKKAFQKISQLFFDNKELFLKGIESFKRIIKAKEKYLIVS